MVRNFREVLRISLFVVAIVLMCEEVCLDGRYLTEKRINKRDLKGLSHEIEMN